MEAFQGEGPPVQFFDVGGGLCTEVRIHSRYPYDLTHWSYHQYKCSLKIGFVFLSLLQKFLLKTLTYNEAKKVLYTIQRRKGVVFNVVAVDTKLNSKSAYIPSKQGRMDCMRGAVLFFKSDNFVH